MSNPAPLSQRVYEASRRMWASDKRGPEPKLADFAHYDGTQPATAQPPAAPASTPPGGPPSTQTGTDLDQRVQASLRTMQAEYPTIRR